MSWSINIGPVSVQEFELAVDHAVSNAKVQYGTPAWAGTHMEMWRQMDAGKAALIHWLQVGAMGNATEAAGRKICATLGGHANPGNKHRRGYAEDAINVSVWYETVSDPEPGPILI